MNPRSMGFSVWLMAGTSETMPSHIRKNPMNRTSAATSMGQFWRAKSLISVKDRRNKKTLGTEATARITMMVSWALGAMWDRPSIQST